MKLTPREEQFTKFIAEAQPESDHDKRKPTKAGDDLAHGLACLVASQKFFPGDAAAVIDAFGQIMAAVARSLDLEERVEKIERELKAARSKKARLVTLREAG